MRQKIIFILCLFSLSVALQAQNTSARSTDSLRYLAFLQDWKQNRSAHPDSALMATDSMIAIGKTWENWSEQRLALLYRIIISSDQFWIADQEKSLLALENLLKENQEELGEYADYYQADLLNRRGNYYFQIKAFDLAQKDVDGVIQILGKKDSLDVNEKRRLASSYRFLGSIAKAEGRYEDASALYRFSIQYSRADRLPYVYKHLGDLDRLQNQHAKAITNYQKSWDLNMANLGTSKELTVSQRNRLIHISRDLADSYYHQEKMDSAYYWLEKAEKYHVEEDPELPNTLLMKATWLADEGKEEESENTFMEAILGLETSFGKEGVPFATGLAYARREPHAFGKLGARSQ